ncbi:MULTISPECIES: GGDEF domain-containing protein [Burkholderia]|uniref:GGDEF domain-containing protein n=1 Tax=Burkholderia TaxID=32008 RepID=UPI00075AC2A5|nr:MULTISPECIES: GGDEF domain-containing protein [Burkholderia]AOJ71388.1 diguanylate cyclase [Burkholderia savannae]KVG49202.1 diguanylate cyclase [Burkholderia sp. MSMB0265]KVG81878.1 diguanylate cyclase [Burkholderia sp. MSMB2040]KVG92393.1 diguanylate cyclase [Burkholderia sp. MSMB2041]KVG97333.1 diguanylate cyclase [Burkholderia sp. MSMB2042]
MPLGYMVIAGAVAVAIVMMSICAAILRDSRDDAFEHAQGAARNTLQMIARDVTRGFHLYDETLARIAAQLGDSRIAALPADLRRSVLFDSAAAAREAGTLYVLDAHGRVRLASANGPLPTASFASYDFFAVLRDAPRPGTYLSGPYRLPSRDGEPCVALSHRVERADGSFAGVVLLAVRLAYFQQLLAAADAGPHGAILLIHADGRIVMRIPFDEKFIGLDLSGTSIYTRTQFGRSGEFFDAGPIDRVKRFYLYRRLDEIPLIVQVAIAEDDIYETWRARAWRFGVLTGVFALIFVLMSAYLAHSLWRKSTAEAALARLAGTDSLTGLHNRRALDETLEREWRRAVYGERPLAILFVDIDRFKRYNDTYGHRVGDEVLATVSRCIAQQAARLGDVVARYGGEEFVVVLPDTPRGGALVVAERVRLGVRMLGIEHEGSEVGFVTVSVGVAVWQPDGAPAPRVAAIVEAADRALYQAKASGRNRVVDVGLG